MIHQFLGKKQIVRRKKITRMIIILGIFLLISFSGILTFFVKAINYIGQPIWQEKEVFINGSNNLSYLTRTRESLSKENKKLSKENSNLKISMIDYQLLKNQNDKLKELLGRVPVVHTSILSSILMKPNNSPYDTMIIDIGKNEGIKENSKVYIDGNVPIGIINKVYPRTSLVELYSNPGKVTKAVVSVNNSNINVQLIGRGGGNFEMSVPIGLIIPKGTMVTLRSLNGGVIAIVEEKISDTSDPEEKIILRAPVNIQSEKLVEVNKN